MPSNRVDQVSLAGVLRNHEARMRALEATAPPSGGGAGIQFHTGTYGADNEGDYLLIGTHAAADNLWTPDGWGIEINDASFDSSAFSQGGVFINTDSGVAIEGTGYITQQFYNYYGYAAVLRSNAGSIGGGVKVACDDTYGSSSSGVQINDNSGAGIRIACDASHNSDGGVNLSANGGGSVSLFCYQAAPGFYADLEETVTVGQINNSLHPAYGVAFHTIHNVSGRTEAGVNAQVYNSDIREILNDNTHTLGNKWVVYQNFGPTQGYTDCVNPIFEVRDDGSIHGRAAIGAITWDL